MADTTVGVASIDRGVLQRQIAEKYGGVALHPEAGFHFHTGRPLVAMLGYPDRYLEGLAESTVVCFAGTGNPFVFGEPAPGEVVVDVGCGAGFDTLIAARMVGPAGRVVAVDMTPEMREKARTGAQALGLANVEVLDGTAEALPVPDGVADVVISNGVVNLCPDKPAVLREMFRVLTPGGRLQIADMLVHREVPEEAKADIDLWSG